MSSTPASSYASLEAGKQADTPVVEEPRPFAPYDTIDEQFVYGKWAYELKDAPRDCMVRALPCITIAQVSARVRPGSYGVMVLKQFGTVLTLLGLLGIAIIVGRSCVMAENGRAPMIVAMVMILVVAVLLANAWTQQLAELRATVRKRFQIEGSTSDDMWTMFCCLPCAAAQMARQTKSSEHGACSMEPRDALPAYYRA